MMDDSDFFSDLLSPKPASQPVKPGQGAMVGSVKKVENKASPAALKEDVLKPETPTGNGSTEAASNTALTSAQPISREELHHAVSGAVQAAMDATFGKFVKSLRTVLEDLGRRVDGNSTAIVDLKGQLAEITELLESQATNVHSRFTTVDVQLKDIDRGVQALRDKQELQEAKQELAKLAAHTHEEGASVSAASAASAGGAAPPSSTAASQNASAPAAVAPSPAPTPAPTASTPVPVAPAAAPALPPSAAAPMGMTPGYGGHPPPQQQQQQQPYLQHQQAQQPPVLQPVPAPQHDVHHYAPHQSPYAPYQQATAPVSHAPPQVVGPPLMHDAHGLPGAPPAATPAPYSAPPQPQPSLSSQGSYGGAVPVPMAQSAPALQPTMGGHPPVAAYPPGPTYPTHATPSYPAPPSASYPPAPVYSRAGMPQQQPQAPPQARPNTRSVRLDDIIADITAMGFSRHQVMDVIANMQKSGQAIDLNVVIDRLTNGRS